MLKSEYVLNNDVCLIPRLYGSVPSGSYSSVCNVLRQWKSRSSLLIESTDSMIYLYPWAVHLVPRGPTVNAQRANVRPAE